MVESNIKSKFANKPATAIYKNRNWLAHRYLEMGLPAIQIGRTCGIYKGTVGHWLRKFCIPCRSPSESTHLALANHCVLSQEAIEWINGELLGDGCLQSHSPWSANFTYSSKYSEYIQYVLNTLQSFGIGIAGRIHECYNKRYTNHSYHYVSLAYVELLSIRKQWYPEGRKIVPRDLELTPLTCRQWYIGDGYLDRRKNENGRPHVTLATCGFTIADVEWLVKQLMGMGFRATRRPTSNIIAISTYSTEDFLDYIGKCPVERYKYKWGR